MRNSLVDGRMSLQKRKPSRRAEKTCHKRLVYSEKQNKNKIFEPTEHCKIQFKLQCGTQRLWSNEQMFRGKKRMTTI